VATRPLWARRVQAWQSSTDLVTELAKNPHTFGTRIVFVHTGGIFGLFPAAEQIASVLQPVHHSGRDTAQPVDRPADSGGHRCWSIRRPRARSFPWGNAVDAVGNRRSPANAGTHAPRRSGRCRNCRLLSPRSARYCRPGFVSSDPADPNAPTRTVLPAGSDAATGDGGDPDRTRSSDDQTRASAIAGTPRSGADKARRPAPLQYRDPDRYEVIAEHGRGGLGRVMRARDKELGRPVAIKEMLHPGLTSELRFFREALITARLEHPGIVPVHEAGRWPDGTPFYAMKLVAGRPLKALIDEATSLDQRLALLPHVIAVCDAIAYAHSRGIIHRDLKPSNVIVGDFGETVVIDWGLAKDIADPDDPSSPAEPSSAPGLTMAGTVLGTPGYMPPEQATGVADTRSDVYSIGALLAHILHGRAPEGASSSPSSPTPGVGAKVPAALLTIVAKATATDPATRYATARALGDDLRHYQTGKLVAAHRYSLAQLVGHWASHNRKLLVVIAVSTTVLAILLLVAGQRILQERDQAEASRAIAEEGRQRLIVSQARGSLQTDPTKALLWVRAYRGSDTEQAQDIAAEALGRGVARFVANANRRVAALARGADNSFYTVGGDNVLRAWSPASGMLQSSELDRGLTDSGVIAFDAVTNTLAHSTRDNVMVLRSSDGTRREVHRGVDSPQHASFSSDGRELFVQGSEGTLVVVDLDSGAKVLDVKLTRVDDALLDGRTVRAVSGNSVYEWTLPASTPAVRRFDAEVAHADVLRSGRVLLLTKNQRLEVLGPKSGSVRTIQLDTDCSRVLASPDERMAAVICKESLMLVSTESGNVIAQHRRRSPIDLLTFSRDSMWVAAATLDGVVLLASATTATGIDLFGHAAGQVTTVEFVDDYLVTGDEFGDIRMWPTRVPGRTHHFPMGDLRRVVASPDEKWFASDSSAGTIRLWTQEGVLHREYPGHTGVVSGLTFSRNGRFIVTAGWDHNVGIWPVADGAQGRIVQEHSSEVMAVAPFRQDAVAASMDGEIRLWSLEHGTSKLLHRETGQPYYLSTTEQLMASGGLDGAVHEYDFSTAKVRLVHRRETPVVAVRYSPNYEWLVAAWSDGQVRVSRAGGEDIASISLESAVVNLAISYDSGLIAVATGDGAVRVLTLAGLQLVTQRRARVKRMVFSARSLLLAAVCHNGMAMIWDLSSDQTSALALGNNSGPPIGIAVTSAGESVVATTTERLIRVPLAELPTVPVDPRARARVIASAVFYLRPRGIPPEEETLFDVQTEEKPHAPARVRQATE
jgi:serine/threonine protein kinase/WD40 repeat protein